MPEVLEMLDNKVSVCEQKVVFIKKRLSMSIRRFKKSIKLKQQIKKNVCSIWCY